MYNQYFVINTQDTFQFVNKVQSLVINKGDILVYYDVIYLFNNVQQIWLRNWGDGFSKKT